MHPWFLTFFASNFLALKYGTACPEASAQAGTMVTKIWTRNVPPSTQDRRRHRPCQLRSQLRRHPQHQVLTRLCKYVCPSMCSCIQSSIEPCSAPQNYSNNVHGLGGATSKLLRATRKSSLSSAFVRAYNQGQSSDSHLTSSVCAVCVHDAHIRWLSSSRFSPFWIFDRIPDIEASGFE